MELKSFGALAGAGLLSFGAQAYQGEAGVFYSDTGDDSLIGVAGEFHLAPVDTQGIPLAEAPFLRRSSNIFASYATADEADVDTLGVGIDYYAGDLFVSAALDRTSFGDLDSDDIEARIGFFPQAALAVAVGVNILDLADRNDLAAELKWVNQMAGETALNVEAELTAVDDDDNTLVLGALVDYYFNRMFSAGVRIEETDADGVDTTFGAGARMFFSPMISGFVEYETQNSDDTVTVGASLRF